MTIIDVKEAFQNIPLTFRSSLMTTMSTPWGRYRWMKLSFGISSALEEWQRQIHTVLEGLQIIRIADDILVPGCGSTEAEARVDHDLKLIVVLEHFENTTLKSISTKWNFWSARPLSWAISSPLRTSSQTLLLFKLSSKCQPQPIKQESSDFWEQWTTSANSARSWAGLHNLTKEDAAFLWSAQHQQALDEAKTLATRAPYLAHYNVNFPVVLQVDASDYGLEAALLQPTKCLYGKPFDEASLQPIAYSSKSFTPTKQRYAQIEKECLAIVEALNKFDQWLLGKSDVTVHTDHSST